MGFGIGGRGVVGVTKAATGVISGAASPSATTDGISGLPSSSPIAGSLMGSGIQGGSMGTMLGLGNNSNDGVNYINQPDNHLSMETVGLPGNTGIGNKSTSVKPPVIQDDTQQNALIKGRSSTLLTGGRGLGAGSMGTTSKMLLGN